jgi:hypothetical protein
MATNSDLACYLRERPELFSNVMEALFHEGEEATRFGVLEGETIPSLDTAMAHDEWAEVIAVLIGRARNDDSFFQTLVHLALVNQDLRAGVKAQIAALETRIDVVRIMCRCAFTFFGDAETRDIYIERLGTYAPATHAAWRFLLDDPMLSHSARVIIGGAVARGRLDAFLLNDGRDPIATFLALYFTQDHVFVYDGPGSSLTLPPGVLAHLRNLAIDTDLAFAFEPLEAFAKRRHGERVRDEIRMFYLMQVKRPALGLPWLVGADFFTATGGFAHKRQRWHVDAPSDTVVALFGEASVYETADLLVELQMQNAHTPAKAAASECMSAWVNFYLDNVAFNGDASLFYTELLDTASAFFDVGSFDTVLKEAVAKRLARRGVSLAFMDAFLTGANLRHALEEPYMHTLILRAAIENGNEPLVDHWMKNIWPIWRDEPEDIANELAWSFSRLYRHRAVARDGALQYRLFRILEPALVVVGIERLFDAIYESIRTGASDLLIGDELMRQVLKARRGEDPPLDAALRAASARYALTTALCAAPDLGAFKTAANLAMDGASVTQAAIAHAADVLEVCMFNPVPRAHTRFVLQRLAGYYEALDAREYIDAAMTALHPHRHDYDPASYWELLLSPFEFGERPLARTLDRATHIRNVSNPLVFFQVARRAMDDARFDAFAQNAFQAYLARDSYRETVDETFFNLANMAAVAMKSGVDKHALLGLAQMSARHRNEYYEPRPGVKLDLEILLKAVGRLVSHVS